MEIIAAIIGGFLAAGAGWILQWRQESSRLKKLRELLALAIGDDLKSTIDLYNQLAEGWEQSRLIWFNLISEINDSRKSYERNRDSIVLFESHELRKRILQYYRKSANHLLAMHNSQQRKYDLEGKVKATIQELRARNPEMPESELNLIAASATESERKELEWLAGHIPTLVSGLERFRTEARDLLAELKMV